MLVPKSNLEREGKGHTIRFRSSSSLARRSSGVIDELGVGCDTEVPLVMALASTSMELSPVPVIVLHELLSGMNDIRPLPL